MSSSNTGARSAAYHKDGVQYVDKVIQLFGDYKRRSFAFLNVQPGQRILDVGCGTGEDVRALAQLVGAGGRVTGLDHAPEMIAAARQRSEGGKGPVDFIQGDVYQLPLDDASFDRARSDRLFQHLDQPERALKEMMRVTASSGWISVLDVDWATLVIDADDRELTHRILDYKFAQQVNGGSGRQLYALLKRAGLGQVEVQSEAVSLTEFAVAKFIWGIDVYARQAADAGVIGADDAERWLHHLQERDRAGTFFASMTGFSVRGQKA